MAEHLNALVLQPAQAAWRDDLTAEQLRSLVAGGGWAALDGEKVLGCGGLVELAPGRAEAWALLAEDSGRALKAITQATRRFLEAAPYRRIEAVTACEFPPGRRWATMLGFRFEGVAEAYLDDGSDAERWVIVRKPWTL